MTELRKPGVKQVCEILNLEKFQVLNDNHTIIEVITGQHGNMFVCGYYISYEVTVYDLKPHAENGLYYTRQHAKISMLAHIQSVFREILPQEILKIIRLAELQVRQTSLFDD